MENYQQTSPDTGQPFGSSYRTSNGPGAGTGTAGAKADVGKRFLAIIIDCFISAVVSLVPIVGGLAGAAYMVCRDGLEFDFMRQRSIGKHLMGLRPVRLDGAPMTIETSLRRNWMFGLGALTGVLWAIPIIGWVLIPFVAIASFAIGVYEIYRVLTDPDGRRWGDQIAATRVVDAEVHASVV